MSDLPGRILVVDDEESLREALQEELARAGYLVGGAVDGYGASSRLAEGWDLVLADLRMPGLSGLQLVRLIRESCPESEIIVMTGYGTIEAAVEALKDGAYDFIQKPFQLDEILDLAAKAVEKVHARVSDAYLRGLLAASHDAILGLALTGHLTLWNAGAQRLFGLHACAALGQRLLGDILPELAAGYESALAQARANGRWSFDSRPRRTQARARDGRLLPIEFTATPVWCAGRLKGLVMILRESSARETWPGSSIG